MGYYAQGVHVLGDYAYVVGSGLQVIDISDPANPNPTIVGSADTPGSAGDVDVLDNYAYVADGDLQVIDMSDPTNPIIVGSVDLGDGGRVQVSGNYAYVAGDQSLQVIDISDPTNPIFLRSVDIYDEVGDFFILENYAYVTVGIICKWGCEDQSFLWVMDISDPSTDPPLVGSVETGGGAVYVSGNYAYVGGLQVIDITDPTNPTIVGYVDMECNPQDVYVSGNYAYMASGEQGLQVVNISDPTNPTIVGSVNTPDDPRGVYVSGNYAYVVGWGSGLQVVDITDPANPTIVGSVDTPVGSRGVHVSGNYAYVAGGWFGLQVLRAFEPCVNVALIDPTKITATVPAGLPEGTHNLHVVNPNGEAAILNNAFTVQSGLCPDISCSTTSHDFGKVKAGSTSRQSFEITNIGNADLMIDSLSITGTDASQFAIENDYCSGQFCVPSGTLAVDLLFSPDSEGTKNANLLIPSNDPDTPTLTVALSGQGTAESGDGKGGGGGVCFIATAAYGFRRAK
jgi:hypothetical protein